MRRRALLTTAGALAAGTLTGCSTSNRDGRGNPKAGDDKIIAISV